MPTFERAIADFFLAVARLWFARLHEELQAFSETLNDWLYGLLAQTTPRWRESLAAFLAEQQAKGRIVTSESVREIERFLDNWAASIDWNLIEPDGAAAESVAELNTIVDLQLDGSRVEPAPIFDPLAPPTLLPDGTAPLDADEPKELPPLVRSAEEYRQDQIQAFGDSPLAMALIGLNQAVNRYLWQLEDRHEHLESPSERAANDVADFADRTAGLATMALGLRTRVPTVAKLPARVPRVIDKSWKKMIVGTAQRTGTDGHQFRIYREAIRMAKSGEYDKIWLNRAYVTATGTKTTPRRLPDILARRKTGQFDAVEVLSKTDKDSILLSRNVRAMRQLPEHQRGNVLLKRVTRSKK